MMTSVKRRQIDVSDAAFSAADELYLAGDFNNWRVPGVALRRDEQGRWFTDYPLPSGSNRIGLYRLERRGGQIAFHCAARTVLSA